MSSAPTTPGALPAPPAEPPPEIGALFSGAQIAVATFIGTPVAGAILASMNFARMSKRAAIPAVLSLSVGLIAIALVLDSVWSSAALFLAVPAWTALAFVAGTSLFQSVQTRSIGFVLLVPLLVIVALSGVARVVHIFAPDAVPSVAELAFDAMGMQGGKIRYEDRDAALKVRHALEKAGRLSESQQLSLDVAREDGKLVVSLQLPNNDEKMIGAVKSFSRALVDHLDEPECITTRVWSPGKKAMLAEGRTCPR